MVKVKPGRWLKFTAATTVQMKGQWGPIEIKSQNNKFLKNTVCSVYDRPREGHVDRVH